ncbi:MAG TPA: glycoside hydrolase family 3 N-terminal domain-containing protein [Ktedonobacteraceae bacterium]
MSDQSPPKSSASDVSKSFAIPSRPARAPAHGQNEQSWKRADGHAEPGSEPDYARAAQSQGQQRPGMNWQAAAQFPVPQEPRGLSQSPAFPGPQRSEAPFALPPTPQGPREFGQSFPQPPALQSSHSLEQPFQRPLQPPSSFAHQRSGASFPQGFQGNGGSQLPPVPPTPAVSSARHRGRQPLYIALAILAVMVVLGGLLSQKLLNSGGGSNGGAQNSALVFSGNGPYARLPLSADQVNAIQHLAGHMKYKALANLYVSHMSLDDKIGQLIMVEYNQENYSSDLDYMINTLHVGGVIMYEFQMTSAKQTKGDIQHMQQRANIPLIISTDEEGGPYVHRLSHIYGYRMSATQIQESGSTDVAKQQGLKTSRDLAALGINNDLAPDVDVNQVNGYDMVTRTFGNTPGDVIKYAGAYLQAMQGNGTIACIKHFPGLGGALTDAHKGLPVVHSTQQEIYDIDLAPFKTFIQSPNALLNPGMIMPTDVLLPSIDAKYPAELSYTFMTKILRNEFGYDGVSLTDALYMQGITNTWDMYTASVMALQAGNDMLLGANGTSQTLGVINAIKQALKAGTLTQARIDESVTRIIALKMQYHLMPTYVPGA